MQMNAYDHTSSLNKYFLNRITGIAGTAYAPVDQWTIYMYFFWKNKSIKYPYQNEWGINNKLLKVVVSPTEA